MNPISKPTLLILHFYNYFLNKKILSSIVFYCEELMQITQEIESTSNCKVAYAQGSWMHSI